MIQCKCCMHKVSDGSAMCDICKLPLLASGGAELDAVSAQFRRQLLEGCKIAVKVHYYEPDKSGKLVEQKSEYFTVADALSLEFFKVHWLSNEYNPPEVNRDIEIEARIRQSRSTEDKTLRVHLNKAMTCARLGVYLDEGLTVRFAVGNQDEYVLSDAASLI